MRVACAILAAGASRRLGRPKQLLVHRAKPLVVAAADCACQSQATACAVVVGAHGNAVRRALGDRPIDIIDNPEFAEGIAASIRSATRWAKERACQALILALCDQPMLTPAHLDRLIFEHERQHLAVASRYCGKNSVPALFPEHSFGDLLALRGDVGASLLLNGGAAVASVCWPEGELDIDSPDAALRLQASTG